MSFVRLVYRHFYRTAYAHNLIDNGYKHRIESHGFGIYSPVADDEDGVLEIGFVEQSPVTVLVEETGEEITYGEGDVFILPPHLHFSVTAESGVVHKHSSVEFMIDCSCKILPQGELSSVDMEQMDGNTVVLPFVLRASKDNEEIITSVRKIARDRMAHISKNYFRECKEFMNIMAEIADIVNTMNSDSTVSPSCRQYCKRAKNYISGNIERRIYIEEIAEYVGLHKNYLTNLFSLSEGMTLTEYINRAKLSYMLELMRKYGYSLSTAGYHVGYTNVNYISRIFRKYYNSTIREYKKIYFNEKTEDLGV